MTSSDDPFEQAARREHADQLHREAKIAAARGGIGLRDSTGMLTPIVVFLGPYLLWAGLRAANHAWSTPTVGKSVISFFFGSGIGFAIYTGWMLLLLWSWAVIWASQRGESGARRPRHHRPGPGNSGLDAPRTPGEPGRCGPDRLAAGADEAALVGDHDGLGAVSQV